jgi:hypothetical protein
MNFPEWAISILVVLFGLSALLALIGALKMFVASTPSKLIGPIWEAIQKTPLEFDKDDVLAKEGNLVPIRTTLPFKNSTDVRLLYSCREDKRGSMIRTTVVIETITCYMRGSSETLHILFHDSEIMEWKENSVNLSERRRDADTEKALDIIEAARLAHRKYNARPLEC